MIKHAFVCVHFFCKSCSDADKPRTPHSSQPHKHSTHSALSHSTLTNTGTHTHKKHTRAGSRHLFPPSKQCADRKFAHTKNNSAWRDSVRQQLNMEVIYTLSMHTKLLHDVVVAVCSPICVGFCSSSTSRHRAEFERNRGAKKKHVRPTQETRNEGDLRRRCACAAAVDVERANECASVSLKRKRARASCGTRSEREREHNNKIVRANHNGNGNEFILLCLLAL